MALRYLFVDFNSYFASVEQQLHPELRNKPVAVVPMIADTTFCIAASYEAKRYGVKTGTRVADAKRMCPGLQLIKARHHDYITFHHRLVEAVESCIHVEKILSVDEMVCELHGSLRQKEKAIELAQHIKETIYQKVGKEMRCSIGIAPNLFLSKTASDMQKPNGLVVLDKEDVPLKLFEAGLQLKDLYGIGNNMYRRLLREGIANLHDLYAADVRKLHRVWGSIEGNRMYARLRGDVLSQGLPHKRVIGHSHILPPDLRHREGAYSVLQRLLQKAAVRMRSHEYLASGMHAKIKYMGGERWEDKMTLQPTNDSVQFINALARCWKENPILYARPFKVSVTLYNLIPEKEATLPLFEELTAHDELNRGMDSLNKNFGRKTVYFAGAYAALARGAAPMRIAFHHIPDMSLERD